MSVSVVVLGDRGMLGTDLMKHLAEVNISARGYDLPDFSIVNAGQIERAIEGASVVINCAAYTNVEKAEAEPQLAFQVNGQAVGTLGRIAAARKIPVVHISTDFVFDGMQDRPYREGDEPSPISAYGASKHEGEKSLIASGSQSCILRVEWTYGSNGVNFIKKMMDAAKSGKPLKVVDDQIGSPTATREVAAIISEIIQMPTFPQGIYHVAAGGYVSRFEMAVFLFNTLGMRVEVNPCKTSDFPSAARRPLNSRFDCSRMEALLGRKIKPWQDMLEDYLKTN